MHTAGSSSSNRYSKSRRAQTAEEQAREMAEELARPSVAASLAALRPTALRFFNATECEAEAIH